MGRSSILAHCPMQRVSVAFHPSPPPLSPSRGEGSPCTFNTPKPTPIPPLPLGGEGSVVRGQSPFQPLLNASGTPRIQHPRALSDAACLSCVSPLTPAPSPLPGARGARAPLTPPNPHQSPLSPIGGEGSVVRGQSPFQPLLNASGTPRIQHPRALSMQRVSVAFHPSPPPLSPSRGEGSPRTFNTPKPTPIPLSPSGRGVGVRGQSPFQPLLNAPRTPRIQHPRALSMRRVSVAFHPSPPPPLPFQGRGEPRGPLTPPNPHQSPSPPWGEGSVVRGQSPFQPLLNAPRTPRIQHPCALSMRRVSVAFTLTPPPLPFQGRGEPCAPLTPPNPHTIPPLPLGGEGSVVRGQSPFQPLLNASGTPRIQHPRHCRCSESSLRFTPHPAPSPLPGRGEPAHL
jgi:hypothetical protein